MAKAHLVGSIPLESPTEVFEFVSSEMRDSLRRIPDGETGERSGWVDWQADLFSRTEGMERAQEAGRDGTAAEYEDRMRYRTVRPASEIELGPLGYAEAATTSYETFKRLRDAGEIPSGVRFQVSLPSAVGVVNARVAPESQLEFEPRYTEALLDELRVITDAIPHGDLAIQWDICMELGILEGVMPHPWGDEPFDAMISRLAHLSTGVPESSELGFHLCYGDYKHTHFMQPKDLGLGVRFSNGLASAVDRSITWIHMPVPADRDDAAYFEPLTELKLDAGTELYLGCVHPDGVEATQRRIDTARELTDRSFGVATECGIGRTPMDKSAHDQLRELFRIHREVTVA